jgi:hypothetical protein
VTEAEFRGPSPAANLVQVDARELGRLRRIEAAASAVAWQWTEGSDVTGAAMVVMIEALAPELRRSYAIAKQPIE